MILRDPLRAWKTFLAWMGRKEFEHRLDVVHAWLIEDMPERKVRILTPGITEGDRRKDLFNTNPDAMNIGHQDWIKDWHGQCWNPVKINQEN